LKNIQTNSHDEAAGVEVVRRAMLVPLQTIADNAGERGSVVVRKVQDGKGSFGFDALALEYGDMVAKGIITPSKVDRTALQNAASVATLLLTTDCVVSEAPKDKDDHAGHGHGGGPPGMGGMGGMGGGMGGMGGMGMGGMGGMM
jgi:chaperonin GroEL